MERIELKPWQLQLQDFFKPARSPQNARADMA
jgi:hypothetical protein